MNHAKFEKIVIALAACVQAAALVEALAHSGHAQTSLVETHLRSLLVLEPDSIDDIYPDHSQLGLGLELITAMFNPKHGRTQQTCMQYLMSMIYLQDSLRKHPDKCKSMQAKLQRIQQQTRHFPLIHPTIVDNFADLYLEYISSYRFRIQVKGKSTYLEQAGILALIRALLLSGVRAAMLWRQVGGHRPQFILARKKLVHSATQLLQDCSHVQNATYH